jgi:glycosyltransferase involved in cell wall biosynthesis
MRVLYDYQTFTAQKFGGISRYYYELIKQYRISGFIEPELAALYSANDYLQADPYYDGRITVPPVKLQRKSFWDKILRKPKGYNYASFRNRSNAIARIQTGDFEVFHPTYYDPYFLPYLNNKPFVLTVYDMIHEIFPEYFLLEDPVFLAKQKLLKKASRVIAISENTKQDIIDVYDIPAEKIDVVYLASSLSAVEAGNASFPLPQRYLLFVGVRAAYKNFYFLVKAIRELLAKETGLYLVCAGGGPFSAAEQEYFRRMGLTERIISCEADNQNLGLLYKNALLFLFPSLYEGFGIPILEAFNCRCPVVASDRGSLKEIAADAAEYIDPKDMHSIRETVLRLIYDRPLREELRRKGYERSRQFSWERCALETARVYQKVLEGRQCAR